MKLIYSTQNRITLYLLKAKLEEHGIYCLIKNEQPPLAGEIPPVLAPPELWVMNDEQFPEATSILENELQHAGTKKSWQCPRCHEYLEGQFDVCWKCGESKPQ